MRYLLVLAVFAAGSIMSFRSPVFAAALFVWNDIFQPLPFARNPGAFPAAKFVLAMLILSFLYHWGRGALKPRLNFLVYYTPLLLAWVFVAATASSVPHAMDGALEIVKYLLPLLLLSLSLRNFQDVRLMALVLTLSVGIWASQAGVHGLIKGVSKDMSIPGGQMTDNNDFMAATDSIIPMLVYLIFSYKGKFKTPLRLTGALMTVLSLAAITFSNSRGAALGLLATCLLYVTMVSKKKTRDAVVIFSLIGIVLLLLPDTFWARMKTINLGAEQTEGSAAERTHMMITAFWVVVEKPIFGVGPDCWLSVAVYYSGLYLDPHNIWLKLTAEIGIPGLILYLVALGVTIGKLYRIRRLAIAVKDMESANLATALIMAIIGFLMPSTFLSHPFSEFLWSWLAISNAFAVIYHENAALAARNLRTRMREARRSAAAARGSESSDPPGDAGGLALS